MDIRFNKDGRMIVGGSGDSWREQVDAALQNPEVKLQVLQRRRERAQAELSMLTEAVAQMQARIDELTRKIADYDALAE